MIFIYLLCIMFGVAGAFLNVWWALDFTMPESRILILMMFVVIDLSVVGTMAFFMPTAVPLLFTFALTKLITLINMDLKLFLFVEL